jgi:hypothetical protein
MRVEVVRSGGLAAITLRGGFDTEALPDSERAAAEDALGQMPDAPAHPPAGADRFQYDLAFTGADGGVRRVTIHEPDVPPGLRGLLERAVARP